jgi:hypothetical protein
MTNQWPEDERIVEVDPEVVDVPHSDPELLDAELAAEEPLELTEDQLRGEDPPAQDLL